MRKKELWEFEEEFDFENEEEELDIFDDAIEELPADHPLAQMLFLTPEDNENED